MTNEEKILQILSSMSQRFDSMDQRFDSMDNRFDSMDQRFDSMDNRLVKLEFKIETDIETRLDALAEGHSAILEQLIPRTRVDELEERVKFLESVIRRINDELQQLKMAQ